MKKFFGIVMSIVIIMSMIVGCGSSNTVETTTEAETAVSSEASNDTEAVDTVEAEPSGEKVVVSYGFWGSEEELRIQTENAEAISAVFPNIEIEVQHYPSSEDFWNGLPAQIAANTAPDILKITNEGAFEYIDAGLFQPIDEYIAQANLDMSSYTESAQNIWKYNGSTYGIPLSVAPAMFFINTDLWEAAGLGDYPTNWEEVKTAAKAMTTDDTYGLIVNLHEYHITNYALSYGGGWNNGTTINSAENVMALETIFSMYDEGIATSPATLGFGWDGEVFANGKGAMSTGGYWYKGYLKDAAPDLNYAVIPVPEGTTKGSTSHSDAIVVLEASETPLEATIAAHFLTNEDAMTKLMENVGVNPANAELASKYYEINPEFKAVEAIVPFAQDFGYPVDTKKFADLLINEIEFRILGESGKSAQEILDEVQSAFE